MRTELRSIRLPEVTLHTALAGPEDGPLVVLLHGFPEFHHGWRHQIEALAAAGPRVAVPDQRGYNLSSKPPGVAAYALDRLADDVLALAEALGRKRFAVAGHDWGGVVAWHLAAREPERIERAAILNAPQPAAMQRYMRSHPSQMLRSWYVAWFQVPALPERLMAGNDFAGLAEAMTRSSRPGAFTAEDLARYRAAWRQPGALTAMVNWYRAALRAPPRYLPERVRVPVRVIWGDRDRFLERGLVEESLAMCDQGEAFHLPEATHWLQHEEPERVSRLLIEFFCRASSVSPTV